MTIYTTGSPYVLFRGHVRLKSLFVLLHSQSDTEHNGESLASVQTQRPLLIRNKWHWDVYKYKYVYYIVKFGLLCLFNYFGLFSFPNTLLCYESYKVSPVIGLIPATFVPIVNVVFLSSSDSYTQMQLITVERPNEEATLILKCNMCILKSCRWFLQSLRGW